MVKTQEELNALKEEVEALNDKFRELTDKELELVAGGGFRDPDVGDSVSEISNHCESSGYDVVVEGVSIPFS